LCGFGLGFLVLDSDGIKKIDKKKIFLFLVALVIPIKQIFLR
jgi:hypothetical protein